MKTYKLMINYQWLWQITQVKVSKVYCAMLDIQIITASQSGIHYLYRDMCYLSLSNQIVATLHSHKWWPIFSCHITVYKQWSIKSCHLIQQLINYNVHNNTYKQINNMWVCSAISILSYFTLNSPIMIWTGLRYIIRKTQYVYYNVSCFSKKKNVYNDNINSSPFQQKNLLSNR